MGGTIKFSERVEGGSGARSLKSGVESGRAKTIFDAAILASSAAIGKEIRGIFAMRGRQAAVLPIEN
jgi:hypothetical protein